MKIKTITCKRVLNLRNYESRHVEMFAEILEGEDPDIEASRLIEKVERKAMEHVELEIEATDLKEEIADLKNELARLEKQKAALTEKETDPDDIPFKSGEAPDSSVSPDNF
ncbi:MAG: hypothetical protein HWQ41_19365 [Nostoc sp. NOS(2021)]|uniref:hypothetical protein n=1 Tax=Nostoc sp. NOS(2021) TaxID=2815407 RepID=UPI0025DAC38F|nr:hypothetical protein [Nostoc sp. NOS(2021)]MBN3897355.1 hypothetical protein [Nostoc sp. NOS(2021)]